MEHSLHFHNYSGWSTDKIYLYLKQNFSYDDSCSDIANNAIRKQCGETAEKSPGPGDRNLNQRNGKKPGDSCVRSDQEKVHKERKQQAKAQGLPANTCPVSMTGFGDVIDAPLNDRERKEEVEDIADQTMKDIKKDLTAGGTARNEILGHLRDAWKHEDANELINVISQFVNDVAKDDFRVFPPNRRYVYFDQYLPSLLSDQLSNIVIAWDTSGSINDKQYYKAMDHTYAVLQSLSVSGSVVMCDMKIQNIIRFSSGFDFPRNVAPKGRGSTKFQPVFDWIERSGCPVSCLVYFTDLKTTDGRLLRDPGFPVLWVYNGLISDDPHQTAANAGIRFGQIVEIKV